MKSASVVVDTERRRIRNPRWWGVLTLLAAVTPVCGCESTKLREPAPPQITTAPYEAVVAVAPFANESGVSIPPQKQLRVGDGLVTAINQGKGWTAVPLNRTIQAMRQLGMDRVEDLESAFSLIDRLGVDAIILGTITEWAPYDPPRFGANAILVARNIALEATFDARALEGSTGDQVVKEVLPPQPIVLNKEDKV